MADEYDIQQSLEAQGDEFLMQNRTFAYVNDSNNGSYNGSSQITIDCSGIANSGKYMSRKLRIYFRQLSKLNLNISEEAMKIYNNNIIEFLSDFDIYTRKQFEKGYSIQMFILSFHKFLTI